LREVEGWEIREDKLILKTFIFKSFRESMYFVNRVADLAEQEKHHPDMHIKYRKVTLELTTHAIKGLSENDFIMASKIDLFYNLEEKIERAVAAKLVSVKVLIVLIGVLIGILLWQKLF
jgi:pterin-4a-carbinolamine dehydratase